MNRPVDPTKSLWFWLFGDRLLPILLLVALAPFFFAMVLARESHLVLGTILGLSWLIVYWVLLVTLHNRRLIRLTLSIPCTLLALTGIAYAVVSKL